MARIELRVPFRDKDEAKRLGARWDPASRVWYVPEELAPARFERWLPHDSIPNVRAPSYFIAASTRRCWRCGATSPVHGFILPPGHETLDLIEDGDDGWEPSEEPTMVCYLDWLSPEIVARITSLTRHYLLAYDHDAACAYWTNHCEYCDAAFGDHETFCEPGHGFLAFTLEDARRITLAHIAEPFAASCGSYSLGVTQFARMRRL